MPDGPGRHLVVRFECSLQKDCHPTGQPQRVPFPESPQGPLAVVGDGLGWSTLKTWATLFFSSSQMPLLQLRPTCCFLPTKTTTLLMQTVSSCLPTCLWDNTSSRCSEEQQLGMRKNNFQPRSSCNTFRRCLPSIIASKATCTAPLHAPLIANKTDLIVCRRLWNSSEK